MSLYDTHLLVLYTKCMMNIYSVLKIYNYLTCFLDHYLKDINKSKITQLQ